LRSDILKPDSDGVPHGYVGDDLCELFFVEKDKVIVKFNLIIFGDYVEVDKNKNIKFGKISNIETLNPGEYKRSDMMISSVDTPGEEIMESIERFVLCMEKLPENYKQQILQMLRELV
jgi:hypothetical protein